MPSFSVHFSNTPAGTAHSTPMPATDPARLPVRISPAPMLVAVSRIAGPTADSRDGRDTVEVDANVGGSLQHSISLFAPARPSGQEFSVAPSPLCSSPPH